MSDTTNMEELSTEDKKKAINLQDLVYVKKYIDDFKEDFETRVKDDTETMVDNMLADVVSGKTTVGNAEYVGGYRKRLLYDSQNSLSISLANATVLGTHDIDNFAGKDIIVEIEDIGGFPGYSLTAKRTGNSGSSCTVYTQGTFMGDGISLINQRVYVTFDSSKNISIGVDKYVRIDFSDGSISGTSTTKPENLYMKSIKIYVIEPMTV